MSIFGKLFGQHFSPSLKSITFDDSRYSYQGERNGARIWFLQEGGGVGLYFFSKPPGLPKGLTVVGQLQDFYAGQMGPKQRIVECRILPLDGIRSIWLVSTEPAPQTGGAVYLGSLTIPFKEFSFVVKMQCQEQGITGVREALVVDSALRDGRATFQNGKLIMEGFSSDDEQFDTQIPQHPLSRIRRELRQIAESLRIEQQVKNERQFELPQDSID
jgi:hypothetical protein